SSAGQVAGDRRELRPRQRRGQPWGDREPSSVPHYRTGGLGDIGDGERPVGSVQIAGTQPQTESLLWLRDSPTHTQFLHPEGGLRRGARRHLAIATGAVN